MHTLNRIIIEGLGLAGIALCSLSVLCRPEYLVPIFGIGMIAFVAANITSLVVDLKGDR